jgi:anaerobic sulfite reductase subunit A
MGYRIGKEEEKNLFQLLAKHYEMYAPKEMKGEGCFSDTDIVRYSRINSFEEIEWEKKSDYSFKEVLLPISVPMLRPGKSISAILLIA